jgi:hypothetical protein
VTIGSVLAVLCLSANTSFVGFPRLCHLLAEDGFLPRPFAVPGRRLVYSIGILFLAAGAGGLVTAFGGITDRLIPLFAVGAFLSFTLSQAGMAAHWWRQLKGDAQQEPLAQAANRTHGGRAKLAVNGLGAIATGIALAVILVAKFIDGAWLTVIVIPTAIILLRAVRRYYNEIDQQVLIGSRRQIKLGQNGPPLVLVPIKQWDRLARKTLEYALRLSPNVTALHVVALEGPDGKDQEARLRKEWHEFVEQPAMQTGFIPPRLSLVSSEFRSITAPLMRAIEDAQKHHPDRPVTVILPELVEGRWWGYLMHANRERRLRARLLRYGGPNVVVSSVPWQLQAAEPAEAIAEDEPTIAAAVSQQRL